MPGRSKELGFELEGAASTEAKVLVVDDLDLATHCLGFTVGVGKNES
jgi:hypothetical protein